MTGPACGDRNAAIRHAQRASGQVSALASMIAIDQPFPQIAQQLLAARGSLDSLLVRLVELELRECVTSREARAEVDQLLRTALGRGAPGRSRPRVEHPSSPARLRPQFEESTLR
jgi:DNA-binding FrmR family transcriptional regulator